MIASRLFLKRVAAGSDALASQLGAAFNTADCCARRRGPEPSDFGVIAFARVLIPGRQLCVRYRSAIPNGLRVASSNPSGKAEILSGGLFA
jgi:hypothetical protein